MNPSPLRYPGGKYKLYKYVAELVKANDCTTYIEPFCGGAAVALELLINSVVDNIVINDYDYTIFCFWDSVLHRTEDFVQLIRETEVTMGEWKRQKEIRDNAETHTRLEIGFSTFFLNRTNRSGIIDKAGPIGGKNQQGAYLIDCRFNKTRLISQIRKIAEFEDHIQIYNLEAIDFIEQVILKKRKSFVFFDPPYYGKGPGLYTNFYSHGDHANLANEIVNQLKNRKWIVTYDNVNAIKAMYAKAPSIEFELQYTLQKKCSGSEVMFFSKSVKRPLNEKDYINILRNGDE
jgi:DNA adenine methylase